MTHERFIKIHTGERIRVQRIAPVRFARATSGPPSLSCPDLDDHGYKKSDAPNDDFRPAQGPVLGVTLGGPTVRVRVMRDFLGAGPRLFVTKRLVSGEAGHLTVAFPQSGQSMNAASGAFLADHVYLQSDFTSTVAEDGDDARARDDAENERLVLTALAAERTRLTTELERTARGYNRERSFAVQSGETQLQALRRNIEEQYPIQRDRILGPRSREALRTLDWLDRVSGELAAAQTKIDALSEYTQADGADVDGIVAGTVDRTDALRTQLQRRRAASRVARPSQFVIEVRIGGEDGPVAAELGVVVYPPKEVEIKAHIVSLGPRGQDDTHLQFDQAAPEFFNYTKLLLTVVRVNTMLAPAGVRLFTRRSQVRRYRIADVTERPATTGPQNPDDPDGWNTYVEHFNDLFPTPGLAFSGINNRWRDIWINIVMNARTTEETGRLNVYFVRQVDYFIPHDPALNPSETNPQLGHAPTGDLLGLGYGSRAQRGAARTVGLGRMIRVPEPRRPGQPTAFRYVDLSDPRLRDAAAMQADPVYAPQYRAILAEMRRLNLTQPSQIAFTFNRGDDRIGFLCGVSSFSGSAWDSALSFGRVMAHELAHVCNVSHYRGGEGRTVKHDLWAHRNMMHNALQLTDHVIETDVWVSSASRTIGYGSTGTGSSARQLAGAMFTMKELPPVTTPPAAGPTGATSGAGPAAPGPTGATSGAGPAAAGPTGAPGATGAAAPGASGAAGASGPAGPTGPTYLPDTKQVKLIRDAFSGRYWGPGER